MELDDVQFRYGVVNFALPRRKETKNTQQAEVSRRSVLKKASFSWVGASRCQNRLASAILWVCAISTQVAEETI